MQVLAIWVCAWLVIVTAPHDDVNAHAVRCDIGVALMWLGSLRWTWTTFIRPLRPLLLPGPHLIIEKTFVVSNMGFQFHRNNEFMFLMLGETVLQIVVATSMRAGEDIDTSTGNLAYTKLAAAASFGLAVEMMYCFRSMVTHQIAFYQGNNKKMAAEREEEKRLLEEFEETQQVSRASTQRSATKLERQIEVSNQLSERHARTASYAANAQQLLLRAKVWTGVQQTMWQIMAVAIMLVGVGVKLTIYAPVADAHAHFARPLRLMVGVSIAVIFALQLLYATVIRRRQHYRHPLKLIVTQPQHCAVVLAQILALLAQILTPLLPLVPLLMVTVHTAIGLVQCILLHYHEYRFKVTGPEVHPLTGVPYALESLRVKASKRRLTARGQLNLDRVIRIQAVGRRAIARRSVNTLKDERRSSTMTADQVAVADRLAAAEQASMKDREADQARERAAAQAAANQRAAVRISEPNNEIIS